MIIPEYASPQDYWRNSIISNNFRPNLINLMMIVMRENRFPNRFKLSSQSISKADSSLEKPLQVCWINPDKTQKNQLVLLIGLICLEILNFQLTHLKLTKAHNNTGPKEETTQYITQDRVSRSQWQLCLLTNQQICFTLDKDLHANLRHELNLFRTLYSIILIAFKNEASPISFHSHRQ